MPRNRLIPGLALVGLLAALGAWYAATRLRPTPLNGTLVPAVAAGDFTLMAAEGPVRLSDFRGRAVLLFFGYTSCPDVCPLTMAKLARVAGSLGDRREDIQVVLVSVDPDVDTPPRLREYVARFDPDFLGVGGTRAELAAVARSYGAYAGEVEEAASSGTRAAGEAAHEGHGSGSPASSPAGALEAARVIPHTAHVFGIDRAGRFRMLWSPDLTAEQIAADVTTLLRL